MESPERKFAKELQQEFITLTEFEALTIACKIRRTNILKASFGINEYSNDQPVFLEAIAMALGHTSHSHGSNITSSLAAIADAIGEINGD